jgi:phosphoglycerate dehydrogenase-like enzyme
LRIHLQSHRSPSNFPLSPEEWAAAAARAPDVSAGHEVSFGDTPEAFQAVLPEVEVVISQTAAMVAVIPFQAPAPRLKMVYCTSAGLERLAPFTWLPPGVPILNNRGTHAKKAGEFGIMALLMLASRIPALATAQRAGRWQPLHGSVLEGRHVVVVGVGALGGSTAVQAKAFGMRVTGVRHTPAPHPACDTVVGMDGLDALLPDAEFLFLAPPLTAETRGMLSRERIAKLPKGAGVVNIGRGGLVDQDAIMDALDDGHLGGAVLDVFTPEPVPPGHRLWTTRNLLMTPHVSADDPLTYNPRSLDIFFDNLRAMRAGKPMPNTFDHAKGY